MTINFLDASSTRVRRAISIPLMSSRTGGRVRIPSKRESVEFRVLNT